MITSIEDIRPGRYRVRRLHTTHNWDEMTIHSMPPDRDGYVLFSLRNWRDHFVLHGLLRVDDLGIPAIYYSDLPPIPIEMQPIETPVASISHVRRVEL